MFPESSWSTDWQSIRTLRLYSPERPPGLWMPSRTPGIQKRGKKLKFPLNIPEEIDPVSCSLRSPGRHSSMASQTDHEEDLPAAPPSLPEIMSAITSCQTAITACQTALASKIEEVQVDVGLMRQDFDKIRSRVTEAEQRMGLVEDTVADHAASIRTLQTKVKALEYRVEDT